MSKHGPDLFNGPIGDDYPWFDRLLRRAGAHASELRDSDIRFVDSLVPRAAKFAERTFVSDRQREWLKDIERRLDEAGVPRDAGDSGARPVDEAPIEAREEAR